MKAFHILCVIVLLCTYTFGTSLKITRKNSNINFLLSADGDLSINGEILTEQGSVSPTNNMLSLKKNGDIKVGITEQNVLIKNELGKMNLSSALSKDLKIYNSKVQPLEPSQMIVGGNSPQNDGDVLLRGNAIDNKSPVSSTYYVDGLGVFEQNGWGNEPEFAYANIANEGRTIYNESGEEIENVYYVKDHLGSTRMTVAENGETIELIAYTAYGVEMQLVQSAGDNTRERFTGKEFEVDGNVNGADGVQLTYFGARYYDPEVGVWNGTDKAGQFTNSYGYTTNPISYVDPDGNYVLGAIIGAVVGAYLGGVASSGLNPGEWNEGDWLSAGIGAISGAMQGSALENGIINSYFNSHGGVSSAYSARAMNSMYAPNIAARAANSAASVSPGDYASGGQANIDGEIMNQKGTVELLDQRTQEYKKMFPKDKHDCARYSSYELSGKVMDEKGIISHIELSPQYTDVSKLKSDQLYAVAWKANPDKIAALKAQGVTTYSHTGAYYNGNVWHRNGGVFYSHPFKDLNNNLIRGGYSVGPTFWLW